MAEVTRTFAALGDPVRSAIVDRLVTRDATIGELASLFDITFQAVSQQIGTLERAGLVSRHREGRTRRVHLEVAPLQEASRWMEARRQRLEERYQRLDEVLADVLADTRADTRAGARADAARTGSPTDNTTPAAPAAPYTPGEDRP